MLHRICAFSSEALYSLHMLMHLLRPLGSLPTSQPAAPARCARCARMCCVCWTCMFCRPGSFVVDMVTAHVAALLGWYQSASVAVAVSTSAVALHLAWRYACKRPLNRPWLCPIAQVGGYSFGFACCSLLVLRCTCSNLQAGTVTGRHVLLIVPQHVTWSLGFQVIISWLRATVLVVV